jgi:hypothetical protein
MIDTALCDSIANPVKIKIILLFMSSEKKQFSLLTLEQQHMNPIHMVTVKKINTNPFFDLNEGHTKIN